MPTPPSRGTVTSAYGWRTHPITGNRTLHNGEDTIGEGNFSPVAGQVIFAGWDNSGAGFGNAVAVKESGANVVWWMAHHSRIDVSVGQWVTQGQRVGLIGKTGAATGIHVHTERRENGNASPRSGIATNPRAYYTTPAGNGQSPAPISSGEKSPMSRIGYVHKIVNGGLSGLYVVFGPDGGSVCSTVNEGQSAAQVLNADAPTAFDSITESPSWGGTAKLLTISQDNAELLARIFYGCPTGSIYAASQGATPEERMFGRSAASGGFTSADRATLNDIPTNGELGQALTSTVVLVNEHADDNRDAIIAAMPTGSGGGSSSYNLSLTIDEIPGTATGTATAN